MEGRELGGEDVRGGVEDVFGSVVEMRVPDLDQAIGVVGCGRVFSIRGEDKFGELGGQISMKPV